MCGRFAITGPAARVEDVFGVAGIEPFPPRYNIAPTQPVLVVTAAEILPEGSNLPDRDGRLMRWGLLPGWVKDPGDFPLLINARSETAAVKPSFRAAMRHRRCIVPASGFYEWRRDKTTGQAQAYWIKPADEELIGFAGLWETWHGSDGSQIDTVAILTASASADLAFIHHRVPMTLQTGDIGQWLDCRQFAPAQLAHLMVPPAEGFFQAIPVSDRVNKVANADANIQAPVEPRAFAEPANCKGDQTVAPEAQNSQNQLSLF